MPFVDRVDAGRKLAARLRAMRGKDIVVLGLPRGGVPVAFEVARRLEAPLDVILVRKLGVQFQPELAMGAIGEGDVLVLNERLVRMLHVSEAEIGEAGRRARIELDRRGRRFRGERPRVPLAGRTAVVVDDGIATGSTAVAACEVVRAQGAARVVLAVPVCSTDSARRLRDEVDEFVCLETPDWFYAVGQFYRDFRQVTDDEVVQLLRRADLGPTSEQARPAAGDPLLRDDDVDVPVGPMRVAGRFTVPEEPSGLVVFAHGSGSGRHSPRNRYVAGVLQAAGLATLLVDLLTPQEEPDRSAVYDVELLADRLERVSSWARQRPECRLLRFGYFGASTGSAAALWAAATPYSDVAAVVSRGGRPDLAAARLAEVRAPTLLVVGDHDPVVLELNRRAKARMRCECRIAVVPGATHLFEEPGTLEQVARLAREWFVDHLDPARLRAG